jgi:peptide/nickel transport system substrate-binding protein
MKSLSNRTRSVLVVAAIASLLAGCATSPSPNVPSGGADQSQAQTAPRAPKILTLAIQRAPDDFHDDLGQRDPGVGGASLVQNIPHDKLVVEEDSGEWTARLAVEQLSVEKGTWKVNPDGTMVTTWKLRPNVKWHDGATFTAEDMVFAFHLYKDPEVPANVGASLRRMSSSRAVDPLTFEVTWAETFVDANRAEGLIPMPRHILEEPFRNDKSGLMNHAWFTTQFVGLGPYKLTLWEPGSHLEFARNDDYFLGRPAVDRLILRLIPDANALIANILSGAADAIMSEGVDIDAAMEVRKRWEGTGNQVLVRPERAGGGLRHLEIQYRPELAKPANGLPVLPVRQAMFQATDRQKLTDVITHGFGPVADSWVPPYHAIRKQVESAVPAMPYDPNRAQQLLAQGGWMKGAGGILTHQTTGERFEVMLYSSQGANVERAINVIADDWKAVGAEVELYVIPIALASDREHRSRLPGAGFTGGVGFDAFTTDRMHSKFITSPANRWTASNRGGYSNPRVDAVLDRMVVTIDPAQRIQLHQELLREQGADLAVMPLYWDIRVIPALQGTNKLDTGVANLWLWEKN